MKYINFEQLKNNSAKLASEWRSREKFGYLVYDNFFHPEKAEEIYEAYPVLSQFGETTRSYLNGKGKYQKTTFDDLPIMGEVFEELNSKEFLGEMEKITGIDKLLPDLDLFGGGLHQSVKGAFLNVHIDFNIHQQTKHYRRMNIIVYMNKDWKEDYNGYLELWDMDRKERLEFIAPAFNRCVVFETNEVSYHGHPKPIAAPEGITRNSIAAYYYTEEYPAHAGAEHSTVYVNTEGAAGAMKSLKGGVRAVWEKITGKK